MRLASSLVLAALLVGMAGCDAAGPSLETSQAGPLADARPSDGFLVRTLDGRTGQSTEHRQERMAVCHYDADAGTYERIEVGAPALDAHLRHGDGLPGGVVEGADVPSTFGDDCTVTPDAPPQCSVARVANPDGTTTVVVTGLFSEPRSGAGVISILTDGPNTIRERIGTNSLGFLTEGGLVVGVTQTARYQAGSDDLIGLQSSDSGGTFTCGPYPATVPA